MKTQIYAGIDKCRIIAAFFIIAIHTSPLTTYSNMADFIFTRVIARTAVPFFFMTSGFFLISRYNDNPKKLIQFIKRTAQIYGIAMVFYLPVNLYTGYFAKGNLLPTLIKDVVFDGTFYHLWYLPAAIMGAVISWLMVRKIGFKWAIVLSAILFIVGLFGDSYYGISEQIPFLKEMYSNLFEVSDYTRNGIFFAPVFFVLGGIVAEKKDRLSAKENLMGFGITLLLMIIEGLLLFTGGVQRHDSMYLMLIPCMYFLFSVIICLEGSQKVILRELALVIYIIHPMIIIVVRGIGKKLGMQELLIDNSLVHYFVVAIVSTVVSFVLVCFRQRKKGKENVSGVGNTERAWMEVNLSHLKHNISELQAALPRTCKIMAVVKANGYGHGAGIIAKNLNSIGIDSFAVATIDEGIELRKENIQGEILIIGYTSPKRIKDLCQYNLIQTLISYDYAVLLNRQRHKVKVHIKIDTGMHRLGFNQNDFEKITKVFNGKYLEICGIYTHLCASESLTPTNIKYTRVQIDGFYDIMDMISKKGIKIPKTHIQSSYGVLNYPEIECDYARIGILLYGVYSCGKDKTKLHLDLRPVLSLKARIVLIKKVIQGESAGYDQKFRAKRDTLIAIISIGYGDGYPRSLSGEKGSVLIQGCRAPIVGQICMDQLTVDITDIPNVRVGDIVTLIGKDQEEEIVAEEIAEYAESITNELLSRMGKRLKIVQICTE